MKKFRNAILSVLFALCCTFAIFCTNSLSAKVNAVENENQEEQHTHTEEVVDGYDATCETDGLTFGVKCSTCGEVLQAQEVISALGHQYGEWVVVKEATETEKGLKEKVCSVCNKKVSEEFDLVVEEETPTYTDEEIEKVLNEAKDWIIALIVSFLGSGGLMAIAKAIINKWFSKKQKELELKVDQLEQDKVIATEQKDLIVSQFAELKQQFNEVLEHNVVLCDYIKTKIEVDEEKEKRINKLLEELLPKKEEGATNEK